MKSPRPRDARAHRPALALGGALLAATVAAAQSQQAIMIRDDGGGPQVVHMSQPDFGAYREPDFDHTDLPVFEDILLLRAEQLERVEQLLDAYLAAFQAAATEQLGARAAERIVLFGGPGGGDGVVMPGDGIDDIVNDALADLQASDVDVDADGHGNVSITVGTWASTDDGGDEMDGGGGGDPPPGVVADADVAVTVETDDDAGHSAEVAVAVRGLEDGEMTEEMRQKITEAAERMARQLQEQLESGELDPNAPDAGAMLMPSLDERIAEHEALMDAAKQFRGEKSRLRAKFAQDVQAELDETQHERWPALDRALVRKKTLPKARLDGEQADLLRLLDEMQLTSDEVEAVFDERIAYELVLHEALVQRNAFVEDATHRVDEAMAAGDPDRAIGVVDRATGLRVAVRSINLGVVGAFAEALPRRAEALRDAALRECFPRIYGTTRAQRAFDGVTSIDELEPEVREAVATLRVAYEAELAAMNPRLQRSVERHQPLEARRRLERVRAIMQGGDPMSLDMEHDDPVRAAYDERGDLDERYIDRLRELLDEKQIAAVPALRPRRDGPVIIERFIGPRD